MDRKVLAVFGFSFVIMFLESAFIRWLPSEVRALAYFKNLVLISSFLGLGLGLLLQQRAAWLRPLFPLLLLLQLAIALYLGGFVITAQENPGEHLWLLYFDLSPDAPVFPLSLAIPLFYILNTLTFVPLGQYLGVAMDALGDPIRAYLFNVAGSITGILLFSLMSFAGLGPVFWFVPALLTYGALAVRRAARGAALVAVAVVLLLPLSPPGTIWSPYYALRVHPHYDQAGSGAALSVDVSVNGSFHQSALDLSAPTRAAIPAIDELYQAYRAPYHAYETQHGVPPESVLIIGAGTGNDVAVALQAGAQHIDAVEIDPEILRLGAAYHPNAVYQDPRVNPVVDDARSVLQTPPRSYDLVIFGTLDSQIALSALSTIRLDNYVYTLESFQQARAALAPGGMLGLYFWAGEPWIQARLVALVEAAFGAPPEVILDAAPSLFNLTVIATNPPVDPAPPTLRLDLPTDDWPYLYHRDRVVSRFYATQILVLVLLAVGAVGLTLRLGAGRGGRRWPMLHLPLLLQGMGFMLLETRSISVLSLLFGATWVVSTLVLAAVLAIIFLAAWVVRRYRLRSLGLPLAGVAVTLALSASVPASVFLDHGLAVQLVGSVLVFLSPIFFSSLIFGILLDETDDVAAGYGSNLLGAVIGGFGEYFSVATGLRALALPALVIFVLVVLAARGARPRERGAG